jgi:lactoylglutathione lyase
MPRIEHIALWVDDLEVLCAYSKAFGAKVGAPYVNAAKGFESRFLTLESGARIELMTTTRLAPTRHLDGPRRTGDGHYESVVLDPEGNRIEITA